MQINQHNSAKILSFCGNLNLSKVALPMGTTKRVPKARKTIYGKTK